MPSPAALLALALALLAAAPVGPATPAAQASGERGEVAPLGMAAVDAMDCDTFVRTFGGIFENSPWVAERAFAARPYASPGALHAAMMAVVAAASPAEIRTFLNAHPDLAGPDARARRMTSHSTAEQGGAGLDGMTAKDFDRFDRLNAAYRAKFGFPFIIAVRGRTREGIVSEFERRLGNGEAGEVETALAQIAAITRMRLERLIGPVAPVN